MQEWEGVSASSLSYDVIVMEITIEIMKYSLGEGVKHGHGGTEKMGKGNLLFHMTGKRAFSFYNRKTGESVRLVLRKRPEGMTRDQSFVYFQSTDSEKLFDVKETKIALPEHARIFQSVVCDGCGETAAESFMHLQDGKLLCRDCYREYSRLDI